MKKFLLGIILSIVLLAPSVNVDAYVNVKGYYRSNGTYVAPYVRSNPNGLKYDNYGYKPSQGLYNSSYGTKGSSWDTPTYITDPSYYTGKSLYESGSTGTTYTPSYKPTYIPSYTSSYSSSYEDITGGYKSYGIVFCDSGYYESGDSCKKAPKNSYAIGSSFYCDYGYEKSGSKCISEEDLNKQEEKKLLNKKTKCEKKGSVWYDNTCFTKEKVCKYNYGLHSVYSSGATTEDIKCSCEAGYQFSNISTSDNSCIKIK